VYAFHPAAQTFLPPPLNFNLADFFARIAWTGKAPRNADRMSNLPIFACMLSLTVGAGAEESNLQPVIILRVDAAGNIPTPALAVARFHVAGILHTAGITVRWENASSRTKLSTHQCSKVLDDIEIMVEDRAAPNDHPGALAYALPFAVSGTRVVVFYDRIAAMQSKPKASLLAYTIVHEVGHMLIGTLEHSESGVMRRRWGGFDYSQMESNLLFFAASDLQTIHRNLDWKKHACLVHGTTDAASVQGHVDIRNSFGVKDSNADSNIDTTGFKRVNGSIRE
jgi:hypothetical protein